MNFTDRLLSALAERRGAFVVQHGPCALQCLIKPLESRAFLLTDPPVIRAGSAPDGRSNEPS